MAEQRIRSNSDSSNLPIYAGVGAGGMALGAAFAVGDGRPKPRPTQPEAPKGPTRIVFDPQQHAAIALGLNSPADAQMYDIATRHGIQDQIEELHRQARQYWDEMPIEQQHRIMNAINDDSIPKAKWHQELKHKAIQAIRKRL